MTYRQQQYGYDQEPLDSALYSVVCFLFFMVVILGFVYFILLAFPVDDQQVTIENKNPNTAVRISVSDLVRVIRDERRHVAEGDCRL
jgi:hypothetical protein